MRPLDGAAAGLFIGLCLGVLGTWLAVGIDGPAAEVPTGRSPGRAEETSERTPVTAVDPSSARETPADPSHPEIVRRELESEQPDARLGVIVYGTVLDERGQPVDGARVEFFEDARDDERLTTSTLNGRYAIHGVRPGDVWTSVRMQGFLDSESEIEIPTRQTHRHDFELTSAYMVRVLVSTPEGEPIRVAMRKNRTWPMDLNAVATALPPKGPLTMAPNAHLSYGIGRWFGNPDREDALLGELELYTAPPAHVSVVLRDRILATEQLDPGVREIRFELSLDEVLAATATVRARIVDAETRSPLSSAALYMLGGAPGETASEEGVVVLTDQLPGLHVLRASARGYASRYQNLRVFPGETDMGTIALTRSVEVRFVVVDSDGRPQSASVSGYSPDAVTSPQATPRHWRATTDFGEYVARVLPGRNIVRATVEGEAAVVTEFHTDSAASGPIRLVLAPAGGVEIDNTSMPTGELYTISIHDAEGRLVFGQHMQTSDIFRAELPTGRYRFEVDHKAAQIQRGTVEVRRGVESRIVVR